MWAGRGMYNLVANVEHHTPHYMSTLHERHVRAVKQCWKIALVRISPLSQISFN